MIRRLLNQFLRHRHPAPGSAEQAFTLIEVLAAIVLLSLSALAVLMSYSTALSVSKLTEAHQAASTMAASKIEQLASVDPSLLDSGDNETDTPVTWPSLDLQFLRSTTVVINADNSRTITVVVRSNSVTIPTTVRFRTRFALWE